MVIVQLFVGFVCATDPDINRFSKRLRGEKNVLMVTCRQTH